MAGPAARVENFALFTGLIVTICSIIFTVDSTPPSLPFAVALWVFGLAWAGLGWRRYVEPLWVTVPSGVILALIAPSIAPGEPTPKSIWATTGVSMFVDFIAGVVDVTEGAATRPAVRRCRLTPMIRCLRSVTN